MLRVLGGPALVVCPSSLVENWIAEAEKFVPDLKAVAIAGPKRAGVLAKNADADVFVTSYALLRQDLKVWKAREFKVVVLDEAQQIKNPTAQVSKAAFQLKAEHRFALTGTPLENSVRDLWSIMNFVSPGYLGGRKEFEERFAKPIENEDAAVQKRLALRLKPVLLRRMKQEVAKDLPEKIEQVVYCDLTKKQRAMYEALLTTSRESIEDAEGGRKRMMALTALLRLRQACCDLRLLDPEGIDAEDASVKLERIEQLVAEAVEGGHRVLVFSQFVQMLQVLVPMLAERGWNFCYLDGATKNRADVVRRFQEDEAVPVFLISLKAGGVGLNLTGADTVIHVDPWWNPAVEAQATDRAHRIGQERVVTSYKLIARDTVEEKILKLQERKRATLAATLEVGRGEGGVNLTAEEIFTLFK
jgi:SNF2 family DNA or RNA helicase